MLGKLIALSKNGEEKGSLPVVNLHFFIGSDLFCDLRINHKEIAAQHCLITSQKNKPALIRNLSRTVPTLVNSTEIGSCDVELKDNDVISIRHKNYKWCYDSSSTPSTSSQTSFVVSSKNRKSWPLFKNKLVAVVTPQRRDEQNVVLPRKRRGTVAAENISKSKSTPKVLAIKSGLRATTKRKSGKRKSSVKVSQNIVPIERTPKVLPSLTRKSVKFLDLTGPRSRLGTRGRNSSYTTPYKSTPAKQKVSVYSTPPSSFGHDKKKPIKSILKTPSSSSTTPRKDEYDEQRLLSTSDILATPLTNVPEVSLNSPSLVDNELLQTPEKGNQPEIVMRSSKRKAALVRSPPSTPKSIKKKRKSPEEKSIEASERAAKKLKQGPPHAIDQKKKAALLQCHRKSLTPHPLARRSGKLITSFPSSFSRRLEINSPIRTKFSPKYNGSRILESLKLPPDSQTPTIFKYTDSEIILDKTKTGSWKKASKSFSKETSPIFRKFTRASRAARISNSLPQKTEATDVLSALDLSRRWPSPVQGEASANSSSQDVSYLSGIKKLFSVDKALDVRELFLENNSESDVSEKSFQSFPETLSGRVSRHFAVSKGKQSTDKDEFMHSFQLEGAQDQPCSTSFLSGSLSSFPSYSSTSRRSLSLKHGRKSTLSPKEINSSLVEHTTQEERSSLENITTQSSSNKKEFIKVTSPSVSRKGRRSLNPLNVSSFENKHLAESSNPRSANETHKNYFSDMLSKNNFSDCDDNMKGLSDSSLDLSVFSLGSFNSSYHKSRTGDSLSLSQTSDVNAVDKETFLENSMKSGIAKDVRVKTPITGKVHSKGRISLRRAVLLASTPKPGKVLYNNESLLSLEIGDAKEKSIHKIGSYKLRMNRSRSVTADVSSIKVRKIMNKGKGFIAKTSSRSASLPLTIDSTILKDLSPISTSAGNLRTSRRNKVNWNGSPESSKKLINSNKSSPVSASSSIQSTNLFESVITDHSHQEVQPELASALNISGRSIRSQRKTEDSKISNRTQIDNSSSSALSSSNKHSVRDVNSTQDISISSSVNMSLGKRGRPSKHKAELSQLEVSTSGKKKIQNVQLVVDGQPGSKQNLTILQLSGSSRRSNRTTNNSKLFVEAQKDKSTFRLLDDRLEKQDVISKPSISPNSSQSSPLKKRSRSLLHLTENVLVLRSSRKADTSPSITPTVSDKESSGNPIIKASSDTRIVRRGRPSKLSVAMRNSQIEKSIVKKRSRSLPSSSDDLIIPKQDSSILDNSRHTRRSSRMGDDSKARIDSSPLSRATLHDKSGSGKEESATPTINISSNTSTGRRGRPSKLSIAINDSQLEKSILKKRSRSLPSSSDDLVTPKQDLSILEDSRLTRRSSRKGDDSKARIDSSPLSRATLHDKSGSGKEESATPTINISSNTSTGRRGRPSKLSIAINNSQLEKSILKKRSRSLPSSSDDLVTPKQDLSILEDSRLTRRSSRKGDDSKARIDSSPLSRATLHDKSGSGKEESATPTINISSNTSTGRRGRPSKLSIAINDSQLEKSILKKRSRSLPSSSDDLVTPKQDSSVLEDSRHTRRSSRKGDDSKAIIDSSLLSPTMLHDKSGSRKEESATPTINISSDTSKGRRGRSSKLKASPQLERSIIMKQRLGHLSSSSNVQVTPLQDLSVLEGSSYVRRSIRTREDGKTPIEPSFTSPSTFPDNSGFGKEDTVTPIITASSNVSVRRRGRPSKLSLSLDSPQLEKMTSVKKHSQSLPSSSVVSLTPKQESSILDDTSHTRRSSRTGDDKLIRKTPVHSSTLTPLTLLDKRASEKVVAATIIINASSNTTVGRKGRSSKLSAGPDSLQLEIAPFMKKRSQSLPSSSDDLVTTKQDSSVLEDSRLTRRSSRKGDDSKVLNKTNTDTSPLSPVTMHDKSGSGKEESSTPTINISSNTSTGRRGRPSKLSVAINDTQLEKSIVKKRSRSLPSSSDDLVTPKQDSSVIEDSRLTRRSSRKGDDSKVLNKTNIDTSPLSPVTMHDKSGSGKEESATPTINISSNTSKGRRGRPSKLSVAINDSQLQKSIVKKRSRSLPSSSDDLVTPKQDSSVIEDSRLTRRSSRKGDDSKVLNKTNIDTSPLSPVTMHDKSGSGKEESATPTINISSNTSKGRRGRPSKLSIAINDSQLQKSIVKKRSRSLPSSSDDLVTPKQDSSVIEDSRLTRRSSRKGDDSKVLNKTNIDTSPLSPVTMHDKSGSGKEESSTPTINISSNTSKGRRGRPSKLSVAINDSQLHKSIVKKRSRSLPSSSDDLVTPKQDLSILEDSRLTRRSSRKGDDSKVLNKTKIHSSFLSPSRNSDKAKSIPPAIKTPSNTSIVTRVRSSKLTVSFDNLPLEKVIKKSSGNLPITPEMTSSVVSYNGQTKRSSRIGDVSKTLDRSSSGEEIYATPNISILPSVITSKNKQDTESKLHLVTKISPLKNVTDLKMRSRSFLTSTTSEQASDILEDSGYSKKKGDGGKMLNKTDTKKSKKRKVGEATPESETSGLLLNGSSSNNISSPAKKKVKIGKSEHSKTFGAFSSTPINTKNPYLVGRSIEKNRSRLKFRSMQSPMGLSPIIGSNEKDSLVSDKSSEVSMIYLRSSKCPSVIEEESKTDYLVISSSKNKISHKVIRSQNSVNLDVTDSSNYGTNNSKVLVSKKKSTRLSTSQNELPFINQTSELPSEKENKSLQLPSTARNSGCSTHSLQDSIKDKMINITSHLRSKTPVIKLTPGKSRTRSRKIKEKGKKSIEEKKALSENRSSKREDENSEAANLQNELISNLKRPSADNKTVNKSILSSPKTSERDVSTVISPIPKRKGRPPKVKDIAEMKNSTNKSSPVSQRRGRSAKNNNLSLLQKSAEAPPQKMSKLDKRKKTIVAEDPSSSSKGYEIRNLRSVTDQLSENTQQKSSTSFPKTRSKVAVLALKTPRKSVLITSPIVKSPALNRRRVGKIKLENILSSPHAQNQGESAKEDCVNVTSGGQNHSSTVARGRKRKQNLSPLQNHVNIEKTIINLSSPVKRRGRSAIHNSSNKKEKPIATSPHFPKRGRLNKVQDGINISRKGKDLNEVIEEASTLPLQKRGRSVKNSDSPPSKKGKSKKDLLNNNETSDPLSLPKRGRSAKIQESNLSVSGKGKVRKTSESVEDTNTSLRRGRSVVKNSDVSYNKKAKSDKDPIINHETINLPKKGRPRKVQGSNISVSGKGKDRKTSESVEGTNTSLRRGRSVVKSSDSSRNKKGKSEKDRVNNETISLPEKGRTVNRVQESGITDSRKKSNKNSEIVEHQTNKRRGRSAVKELLSSPAKQKRPIESEGDGNFSVDSTLPNRGRSAKRVTRNNSEKSTGDQSTLPLQKRGRPVVANSDSSVKRGKSKKDPTDANVVTSPSIPKRGRPAKVHDVAASMKDASIKDSKSISPKQKSGRSKSVAVGEERKGKSKQDTEKNTVNQSSSSKKGRPVVSENISPRRLSAALKKTSPKLLKRNQVTKSPGRRGNLASSPQVEIRKVSERSKAIKKSSKTKDIRPLKSAIKKSLSKRLSRKSSSIGFINHGRRKVHFNNYVARNSNAKKK